MGQSAVPVSSRGGARIYAPSIPDVLLLRYPLNVHCRDVAADSAASLLSCDRMNRQYSDREDYHHGRQHITGAWHARPATA